jgi:predicted Rossmann-fold nucleotide-binding protein
MGIERIVSGGQSGVDRAALDVALSLGIPCGGWCPAGRRAEDGRISPVYPLEETPTDDYAERTRWNVRDSDGTLILSVGPPTGGTALTEVFCTLEGRPCIVVDLTGDARVEPVLAWARAQAVRVLNVAGPRESSAPGVHALARAFLQTLLLPRETD